MCIAIVKPIDKTISEETLKTCFTNNKDGCGFAYCKDGTVYMNKYMKFEDFIKDYKSLEATSPMLIHFRIATHGGVNIENTHPFKLNNKMALIHNGIISGYGDKGEGKSDTRDFIDKVIGNISHKMWKNPSFIKLVGDAIGYSKLGILDKDGNYYIVNEHKGEWNDGVWYSNSSYKPKTVTKTNNNVYPYSYYYEAIDEDYKQVWKCKDCGKEFVTNTSYRAIAQCEHCKKWNCEEIGWVENGAKFYYNDISLTKK